MNRITLFGLMLSLLSTSAVAGPKWVRIDLTKNFSDTSFNLLDDSLDSNMQGVEVAFDTRSLSDKYEIEVIKNPRGSEPLTCEIVATAKMGTRNRVRVQASTGVDDGSNCQLVIKFSDGKKAVVELYSTGT